VTDVVTAEDQASFFPVRITVSCQCFAQCKFKADERTCCCSSCWLYTFWWFTPPLSQRSVGRVVGEAGGVYEPQLPVGELILLLAFFGLRALLFLQSVTAFELSYSGRCILIFREAETSV